MPPLRLPLIDPEVLALVMFGGAVVGAISAGLYHIGGQWAAQTGREHRILPELAGLLQHKEEQPA